MAGRMAGRTAAGLPQARRAVLLDTGFLVALFDSREPLHASARRWLAQARDPLWSVPSVWVEAAHFLPARMRVALARMAASGAVQVVAPDAEGYARVAALLERYIGLDPDWADAELVWLAESAGIHRIATVDEGDFRVWRIRGRRAFDIVWPSGPA